jgi:hypothetical protein
VLKSHAARDLLDALETLMNGGTFFGPDARKVAEAGKERKDRGVVFCVGLRLACAPGLMA